MQSKEDRGQMPCDAPVMKHRGTAFTEGDDGSDRDARRQGITVTRPTTTTRMSPNDSPRAASKGASTAAAMEAAKADNKPVHTGLHHQNYHPRGGGDQGLEEQPEQEQQHKPQELQQQQQQGKCQQQQKQQQQMQGHYQDPGKGQGHLQEHERQHQEQDPEGQGTHPQAPQEEEGEQCPHPKDTKDPGGGSSSKSGSCSTMSSTLDSGWSWMVVLGAWLVCFLLAGFTLSFTIVYQELRHQYGGSAAETAWVLATYGAVRMFSSPMVSALCNAYSHRQVVLIGSVINSLAMVVSGFMPSLNWLYLVFGIIGGFSSNMVYLPPFPVIGYYFERRRGLAMALASTGCGLGGVVMAPLIEFLFRVYGYSGGMLIIGGLMLNCCVGGALLRPVETTPKPEYSEKPEKPKKPKVTKPSAVNHQSAWYYGSVASFGSFMALDKVKARPVAEKEPTTTQYKNNMSTSRNHLGFYRPLAQTDRAQEYSKSDPCLQICHKPKATTSGLAIHISQPDGQTNVLDQGQTEGPGTRCMEKVLRLKRALVKGFLRTSDFIDLHLLTQPRFILFCLMMLSYYTCFTTTNTFISGLCMDLGFTESQVALMLTISYALDTPSRLVSGALFDVHSLRNLHVPIMTGLGLAAALTALLLPFPTTIPGLFVMWAVYQFLFNGTQAQQVPLIVEIVGVDKAMSACGLARVFMGVGEVIGPTMGGAIKDSTGSYHYAFYIAGATFIIGCLIFQTYDIICRVRMSKSKEVFDPPKDQKCA